MSAAESIPNSLFTSLNTRLQQGQQQLQQLQSTLQQQTTLLNYQLANLQVIHNQTNGATKSIHLDKEQLINDLIPFVETNQSRGMRWSEQSLSPSSDSPSQQSGYSIPITMTNETWNYDIHQRVWKGKIALYNHSACHIFDVWCALHNVHGNIAINSQSTVQDVLHTNQTCLIHITVSTTDWSTLSTGVIELQCTVQYKHTLKDISQHAVLSTIQFPIYPLLQSSTTSLSPPIPIVNTNSNSFPAPHIPHVEFLLFHPTDSIMSLTLSFSKLFSPTKPTMNDGKWSWQVPYASDTVTVTLRFTSNQQCELSLSSMNSDSNATAVIFASINEQIPEGVSVELNDGSTSMYHTLHEWRMALVTETEEALRALRNTDQTGQSQFIQPTFTHEHLKRQANTDEWATRAMLHHVDETRGTGAEK